VGKLGQILCGAFRPGHFDGVATVVAKLLLRNLPHIAVFGEKDYQQLCIIQRMVYDLDMPIEILGVPTIREADGLALSSRNAYLTAGERNVAPLLYNVLSQTAHAIGDGEPVKLAISNGIAMLFDAGFKVDYMELRTAFNLEPLEEFQAPARLLAAAWLGKTRLIDNLAME
jgi:pantoate--beta-alanine ligase